MKKTPPRQTKAVSAHRDTVGSAATRMLVEVPRAPYAPTHTTRAQIRKAVRAVVAARS